MNNNSNVAIIISTYDGANDLWKPLEESYLKHWSDVKYPIYLTSNYKKFDSEFFTSLEIGDEISWSDNILKSLLAIDEDYVLLTFDDLFIKNKIDNEKIERCVDWAVKNDINYVQLYQSVGKKKSVNRMISEKINGTEYRNATVFSLWKKSVLIELLDENENAWQFETNGNLRSFKYEGFYSANENLIPYFNGVVKGKWNPIVQKKLSLLGYSIDKSARETFNTYELIKYELVKLIYKTRSYLTNRLLK